MTSPDLESQKRPSHRDSQHDSAQKNRQFVVYYSRKGTTETVANDIEKSLSSVTVEPIRPQKERSYWNWLARSFIPGSRVPIEPLETDFNTADTVFLGTPKWTLSCPPFTEFLRQATFDGTAVGLFITYGGFDERRYAEALQSHLKEMGAAVRATVLFKREEISSPEYHQRLDAFCDRVLTPTGD